MITLFFSHPQFSFPFFVLEFFSPVGTFAKRGRSVVCDRYLNLLVTMAGAILSSTYESMCCLQAGSFLATRQLVMSFFVCLESFNKIKYVENITVDNTF